ncbi:MAG: nitrogen fixation protein [Polaribacter sp.]
MNGAVSIVFRRTNGRSLFRKKILLKNGWQLLRSKINVLICLY